MSLLYKGALSICVTAPTGMGKGLMIEDLALEFINVGGRVILFTDRKMLTKQTGERFTEAGIHFGYASASHGMDLNSNMTIASLQTIRSRVKRGKISLPHADLMICDEAHKRGFDYAIEAYRKANPGISLVGYTASPVGLFGKYDHLVVAGTKPEGRAHGALVPCRVYSPSEPDMLGVRMNKIGEYEHKGMVKRVMQCTVFADVFDSWKKYGGQGRPTLVWAPGVPESRWIVEQFRERGITAAHIDGETEEDERERIREGSRSGAIQVVSSFGVLREGIDWPWISYGILLQVCGAYETFVQIVGRILRAYRGKSDAILQDHSGTWWRHGSPNFDREWSLEDTNISIASERQKQREAAIGDGKESTDAEPICCQKCHGIRIGGATCPHCGYASKRSVRMIRKETGELVAMEADADVKRKSTQSPEQKAWLSVLFRCGATGRTFNQASGLFYRETGLSAKTTDVGPKPAEGSPDWYAKIEDVYPKFNRRKAYA